VKKNLYFVFIAASFAFLAAAPGRLAYGLPLALEFFLLSVSATAFNSIAKKMALGALQEILSLAFIIFMAALYKQILILFSPVIALALSFLVYLPAASTFLLAQVFSSPAPSVSANARLSAKVGAFAFAFFFLRDVLGYGAISVPAPGGIKEAVLFNAYDTAFLSFFATIPGALLILIFCMSLILAAQTRFNILEKAGAVKEEDNENA
jgi:hypothetical protein